MRAYLVGLVVIASAIGCNVDTPETGQVEQHAGFIRCPDPDDCTVSNGGGVYTQECGNAHLGAHDFMIERFINGTYGGVTLKGRGFDASTGHYVASGGTVSGAWYHNSFHSVYAIHESLTSPEFDLDANGSNAVTGDAIAGGALQLDIKANDGDFTLTWWDPKSEPVGKGPAAVHSYEMLWNVGDRYDQDTAKDYCHLAPDDDYGAGTGSACPDVGEGAADNVVFQQGIGVNPVSAQMARNSNFVTLSCRQGAVATARLWGFAYRGDQAAFIMFEAAMHMKRASYCGDDSYFTRPGTNINVTDTGPTQQVTVANVEAAWGLVGGVVRAKCVDASHLRQPNLTYYGMSYDPTCGGNANPPIPTCNSLDPLADNLAGYDSGPSM